MISFKRFLKEENEKAPLPKTKEDTEKALWDFEDCIEGGVANCDIVDTAFGPAVNVIGSVNLKALSLEYLPFRFNTVKGDFHCSMNKELKSVEGAPKWIKGMANFEHCWSLKNLDYLGLIGFQCEGVANFSYCKELERVSDKGQMLYTGGYIFSDCERLASLKGIGTIFGNLNITNTAIHSLHDFHKHVKFGEKSKGELILFNGRNSQEIKECGLNLMMVKGLKTIMYDLRKKEMAWCEIIEAGIQGQDDVLDVQDKLIDAGFEKQARL